MKDAENEYGNIVKLDKIGSRQSTIFLFSLYYYRKNKKHIFNGQGKLWHDFRSKVNPHMMQPRMIKQMSLWKIYNTRNLKKFFLNTSTKAKYETMNNSTNLHDCSILEKLLHIDKVTAQVMALDMLMADMYSNNINNLLQIGNVSDSLLYYTFDAMVCHSLILRGNTEFPSAKEVHPFAYMPFGFGSRTCIGRRFAEMELETLLLTVIRNFRIEWHHGPLEYESRFINTLVSSMRFKLIDLLDRHNWCKPSYDRAICFMEKDEKSVGETARKVSRRHFARFFPFNNYDKCRCSHWLHEHLTRRSSAETVKISSTNHTILTILIYARGQKAFRRNVVAWKLQIFSKFVEKHARVCELGSK
ncbi:C12B2 protein, partial [Acromyrmex insinuator]